MPHGRFDGRDDIRKRLGRNYAEPVHCELIDRHPHLRCVFDGPLAELGAKNLGRMLGSPPAALIIANCNSEPRYPALILK
jgi:hypothetical protein